jgi:membrane fusion protein, copper/silver efflux system
MKKLHLAVFAGATSILGLAIWLGFGSSPLRQAQEFMGPYVNAASGLFGDNSGAAKNAPAAPGDARRVLYYRNPMGAPDISPVPKKDSMGMDYIPVYDEDAYSGKNLVRIAPEKVQRAGVRTAIVGRPPLSRIIRAPGTIVADEARVAVVTARFEGFVEELYVPLTGTNIFAGQPLLKTWIAGLEVLLKQTDYLVALRNAEPGSPDVRTAENNLRLFGMPDQAIQEVRRTGEPLRSIVLTAPASGTVIEKAALKGARFAAGDSLFKVADLSAVWVIAQVAERDIAWLKPGQPVKVALRTDPGRSIDARIGFLYPELNAGTRTANVRIEIANAGRRIMLGQYAEVTVEVKLSDPPLLAVPDSALLDTGRRQVVWIARGEGLFEARQVTPGARGEGMIEIVAGLSEGEVVVATGNFLIDAESNLRAAISGLLKPEAPR